MSTKAYLSPDWPGKPVTVQAVTTLRTGGVSEGGYRSFNLASHVGDDSRAVQRNRERLADQLNLPAAPVWLDQVHSNRVVDAASVQSVVAADASISRSKGVVCAVLTADCLPVFFCNRGGTEVAVAHAGWRGLHAGVLTNTVAAMSSPVDQIMVSFGPAIGPQAFEVGEDVLQAFVAKDAVNRSAFATTGREGHYLCDIYQLAANELRALGIQDISGGRYCTYTDNQLFYSYRKQPATGRMASLIWLGQGISE